MQIVILAGGGGTRLFPLSRQERPKQFLPLLGKFSLLQETVRRALGKYPLLVVTQASYQTLVQEQLNEIDAGHVPLVIEPCRKNTASAIALALRYLAEASNFDPNTPILVLPSDHWISPLEVFFHCVERVQPAVQEGKIVTFGISPTRPETGYGYIRLDSPFDAACYHVRQFVEKPDRKRAEQLICDPMYYWNAGIFAFSAATMWESFALHLPALHQLQAQSLPACLEVFPSLPEISIDYGVIEKTDRIVSCPLPVQWSDLGSWESLYEISEKDSDQNVTRGDVLAIDTKKSLILGEHRMIAAIGLEEMVIVDTGELILIGKKPDAEKIRDLAKQYDRRQ